MLYPVGSIYLSVNAASPATIWGGTWEQIQDRFLLAAGSTYSAGTTGGAATHTLTTSEMPSHTHTTNSAGGHTHTVYRSGNGGGSWTGLAGSPSNDYAGNYNTSSNGAHTHTINSTGGNTAHNNMPPYLAVYIWKRTA